MQKPITPFMHGLLDYSTAVAVAAAPVVLGMSERPSRVCYALAGGYALMSLLTDYPLSVRDAIPFKAHGAAEVAIGAALPALPWALGFAGERRSRDFLFGLAAVTGAVALLTDWDKQSEKKARRLHRPMPRLRSSA